jgi:5'-3' exonuclease
MGRKKAKQLLRRGGGDACIEALDQMWEKKKKADAKKEAKKEERFNKALEIEIEKLRLEQVRAASEQDRASLKRMIEEERIMTMDTSGMTVQ